MGKLDLNINGFMCCYEGEKSGVEQSIRDQKAPHLMDIDGDSVHHLHNSSKRLCAPFNNYLEDIFGDLHTDFKYSQDLVKYLSEICTILGVTFSVPERFVSHRWLSAYDISLNTKILMDAYLVFYYGFLNHDDKLTYEDIVKEIYKSKEVSLESKPRIKEIHDILANKKMTDDGKRRKQRIIEKLFHTDLTTKLQLSFYMAVLQILKKYVCVFQSSDTMVHQLHDAQFSTFKEFLACFWKPEVVAPLGPQMLKNLELDTSQFLKPSDMFVGADAQKVIQESGKNDSCCEKFLNQAANGFVKCAQHMQNTLPINSPTLKALSCIDPLMRSHSVGTKQFKRLSTEYVAHILTEEELSTVSGEINSYSIDHNLPAIEETGSPDIAKWWSSVNKTGKYPVLCKVAFAALSIFHGPLVASTFNIMGDIIDPKSASTKVETYSAIQTVIYTFKAKKTNALKFFERKDVRYSKLDRHMCINMRSAAMRYKRLKMERQQKKVEKLNKLKIKHKVVKSKQQMKTKLKEACEMKYIGHVQKEALRAKKRLTAMTKSKQQMKDKLTEETEKRNECPDQEETKRAKKRMMNEKLKALAAKRKRKF